jgi:hypothetical protein
MSEGASEEKPSELVAPKRDEPKPWEGKLDPNEAIELLRKRAYLEESRQLRLVELGDRTNVYEPAMREAYVLRWIANWLEQRKIEREKPRRY